jgi:mono/diheme cytochrome c family protein
MVRPVEGKMKKFLRILTISAFALSGSVPVLAIAGAASFLVAIPTIAIAQDEPRNVSRGREIYRDKAKCLWCHGWDGLGWIGEGIFGPSLRESSLDMEALVEVISCGRIGKEMPAHDKKAYDDDRCYGLVRADLNPKEVPPVWQVTLRTNEIEMVAAFLIEELIQKELTLEYCVRFYSETAATCAELK